MLELSNEPKRLVSTFLTYRNDIDIYTEDEIKDKEFYKVLFNRLLENKIKINDITPLGGKTNVIERCKNEPNNGRKKLFIIDGDVTIIHGQNIPNLNHLFVLDAYCIENYLIDKISTINFIYFNCGIKSIEEIENELEFENWLTLYSNKLIDLFIHFAVVDFFKGHFKIYNVQKYHLKINNDFTFSEDLVEQEISKIKADILQLTTNLEYDSKYNELKAKWDIRIENLLTIVSGRDYLIPIVLIKTIKFKKSNAFPSIEEAKILLAQNCNLNRLANLKVVLESL